MDVDQFLGFFRVKKINETDFIARFQICNDGEISDHSHLSLGKDVVVVLLDLMVVTHLDVS